MLGREGVDLALTTNGQALAELAGPLWQAGLRRINISLDSLDPSRYAAISRGGRMEMALAGIAAARTHRFNPIKLNAVVMRGHNDADVVALARWGLERGLWVRFLEVMPIGPAAGRFDELFVPSAQVMSTLSAAFDLHPCPAQGGTARYYQATDGHGRQGVIGLISSCSQPFCAGCRRLRLTASGELIGCLAVGKGIDLRPILQQPYDDERLVEAVGQVLDLKRSGRGFPTSNLMVHTGG
jgi:cyclic pyranopterin phosphate synthase